MASSQQAFVRKLQKKFGGKDLSQWIHINTGTHPISTHSSNLRQTADMIYFEGKNGRIGYALSLSKFSIHFDYDDMEQNISECIGFYVAICYSSQESRPIFMSANQRLCEGILCDAVIGDYSAATAEWRLYGPYVIDINSADNDAAGDDANSVHVQFESAAFFPHITQLTFVPVAVYNVSRSPHVLRCIEFARLTQLDGRPSTVEQNLDIAIVDAIKRRSLSKTPSYQNFIANVLLYVDASKPEAASQTVQASCNMVFDASANSLYCSSKQAFVEYPVQIRLARPSSAGATRTYNHRFQLTLSIEYAATESRPLQLLINETRVLQDICGDCEQGDAIWRVYCVDVHSQQCRLCISKQYDAYEFSLRLQTDGLFPRIHSIMLMQNEPTEEKKTSSIVSPYAASSSSSSLTTDAESSFLKLATAYKQFITPPSDFVAFEPFINSVKNICYDTYFRGPSVSTVAADNKSDEKESSYPALGITLNNEMFVPDRKFYHSQNVDGLWICVSRNCPNFQRILEEAVFLVQSFIPIEIRRLFLKYKHGRYRPKFVGPMRLIILSHTAKEEAGQIPELRTNETGRNGTAQPFVFSSSDDFNRGFYHYNWFNGRLTAHELVHAVDMVVRQLIDPCFMLQLDKTFNAAKESGAYPPKAYAMSDRHEYLAEIVTVFLNIPPKELYQAGFKNKNDMKEKDVDGYNFVRRWFLEPKHSLPVLDVFKKYKGYL